MNTIRRSLSMSERNPKDQPDSFMGYTRKIIVLSLVLASVIFVAGSCKKANNQVDYNPLVNSSKDLIYIEDVYTEIFYLFYKVTNIDSVLNGKYTFIDDCDVRYDAGSNQITFGYGAISRHCYDGKFRRNSYRASFNGNPDAAGTVSVITFDSLFVNDDLVEGSVNITRLGPGPGNSGEWLVKVNQGTVERYSADDTVKLAYSSDYTFTLVEGGSTPENFDDDLFHVSGSTEGISAGKHSFSTLITDPLEVGLDCFWILAGKHEITVVQSEAGPGTIDYITGDGCNYRVDFYFDDHLFYDYLSH